MCDGNLAALNAYEEKIAANELAYENLLGTIEPFMREAREQLDIAQKYIDDYGFNIEAEEILREY